MCVREPHDRWSTLPFAYHSQRQCATAAVGAAGACSTISLMTVDLRCTITPCGFVSLVGGSSTNCRFDPVLCSSCTISRDALHPRNCFKRQSQSSKLVLCSHPNHVIGRMAQARKRLVCSCQCDLLSRRESKHFGEREVIRSLNTPD